VPTTDLKPGKRRIFVVAGVGGHAGLRWADVDEKDSRVDGWIRAGLVKLTGPKGEPAPARLVPGCCGSRF
jgi:hypothetical protein